MNEGIFLKFYFISIELKKTFRNELARDTILELPTICSDSAYIIWNKTKKL